MKTRLHKMHLADCAEKQFQVIPLDKTFVVIKTFSFPSLNRSRTAILCSTVSSPDNMATAWPSFDICSDNQLAVFLVYNFNICYLSGLKRMLGSISEIRAVFNENSD